MRRVRPNHRRAPPRVDRFPRGIRHIAEHRSRLERANPAAACRSRERPRLAFAAWAPGQRHPVRPGWTAGLDCRAGAPTWILRLWTIAATMW